MSRRRSNSHRISYNASKSPDPDPRKRSRSRSHISTNSTVGIVLYSFDIADILNKFIPYTEVIPPVKWRTLRNLRRTCGFPQVAPKARVGQDIPRCHHAPVCASEYPRLLADRHEPRRQPSGTLVLVLPRRQQTADFPYLRKRKHRPPRIHVPQDSLLLCHGNKVNNSIPLSEYLGRKIARNSLSLYNTCESQSIHLSLPHYSTIALWY